MDYLYGELADPAAFEAHLRECAACRREVEQLRGVRETLAAADAERAPEALAARIKTRLRARTSRAGWFARFSAPRHLALAAAAVLLAVFLVFSLRPGRETGFATPPADAAAVMLSEAEALSAGDRAEEALAKCRELLRRHPDFARRGEAYTLAIECARRLGRPAEAAELEASRNNDEVKGKP